MPTDRTAEGIETRQLAPNLASKRFALPLKTCGEPWRNNREMYDSRNEVERLFRMISDDRWITSRFSFKKLGVIFLSYIDLFADRRRTSLVLSGPG